MHFGKLCNNIWDKISQAYNLPTDTTVTPISIEDNHTYQLCLPGGIKQVLRLYQSNTKIERIQSELEVMSFLNRKTDLIVPLSIVNQSGEIFTAIDQEQQFSPLYAVLFSFINGEPVSSCISEKMMFQVGETLGKLDIALQKADSIIKPIPSRIWTGRNGYKIINWSLKNLANNQTNNPFLKNDLYSQKLLSDILRMAEYLKINFTIIHKRLPHQLLHLDAHLDNLIFDKQGIGILDFANIGYGVRIDELVSPLFHLYELEIINQDSYLCNPSENLCNSLISGYQVHIKLSNLELKNLVLFQAIKFLGILGWTISHQDQYQFEKSIEDYFELVLKKIRELIELHKQDNAFQILSIFPYLYFKIIQDIKKLSIGNIVAEKCIRNKFFFNQEKF